jgi:hypothetical protein
MKMAKTTKCSTCGAKFADSAKAGDAGVGRSNGGNECVGCAKSAATIAAHDAGQHPSWAPARPCAKCSEIETLRERAMREEIKSAVAKAVAPLFAKMPELFPLCFTTERSKLTLVDWLARLEDGATIYGELETIGRAVGASFSFEVRFEYSGREKLNANIRAGVNYGAHGTSSVATVLLRVALIESLAKFVGMVELVANSALAEIESTQSMREKSRRRDDETARKTLVAMAEHEARFLNATMTTGCLDPLACGWDHVNDRSVQKCANCARLETSKS